MLVLSQNLFKRWVVGCGGFWAVQSRMHQREEKLKEIRREWKRALTDINVLSRKQSLMCVHAFLQEEVACVQKSTLIYEADLLSLLKNSTVTLIELLSWDKAPHFQWVQVWNLNNQRTKLRAEWFFSWLCCDVTSPCPWRRARQQLWPGFTVRQTGSWCRPQRGNSSVLLLFLSPRHDSVSSFQDVAKNRSLLSYPDCDRHINIYATLISPMGRAVGLSSAGWSACERTQLVHLWSTLWEKEDFVQLRSGWISLKTCSCHSITNSVV